MFRTAAAAVAAAALLAPCVAALYIQEVNAGVCRNAASGAVYPAERIDLDFVSVASLAGETRQCSAVAGSLSASFYYEVNAAMDTATYYHCESPNCATGSCSVARTLAKYDAAAADCGLYFSVLSTEASLTADKLAAIKPVMASTPSAYYYAATVAATGDCKTLAVTTGAVFHVFETCTAANSSAWIKTTLTPDGQATLSNALCPTSGCTSGCVTLSTHVKPAPRGDLSCVSRAGSQNVYTAATAIAATSVFSGTGGSWSPSANSTSSKDKAKEADVPVPVSTNSSGLLTTLSPLAIAGIAVGGVIFLGLCAGLVLVVTRRTNKSSGADSQQRQTFLPKPVTSTTAAP